MKRSVILFFGASLLLVFTLSSCRKIAEDTLETRCENLSNEITDALDAFGANPTVATCEDYKEAVLNYADDCTGYAYYNNALEAAAQSIDCSIYSGN